MTHALQAYNSLNISILNCAANLYRMTTWGKTYSYHNKQNNNPSNPKTISLKY